MEIKILRASDNINQYLECVSELNSSNVLLDDETSIKTTLYSRPTNILTFVGLVDNDIVCTATTIMEKKLRYSQLCCHIEDVGVHPSQRGKGYGIEIVKYCISFAKKNNCYKVKLNCSDNLIPFYEKLGFKKYNNGMALITIDI